MHFTVDQPFWGDRVEALGVGPRRIPQKKLTAQRLATALTMALDNPTMATQAQELGARIGSEDGLAQAAVLYEQLR